jgi:hypothetical protein
MGRVAKDRGVSFLVPRLKKQLFSENNLIFSY